MSCISCTNPFRCTGRNTCEKDNTQLSPYKDWARGKEESSCVLHFWVGTGSCPHCTKEELPAKEPTNLVVMRETNLRDIPATLRKLADDIEAGTMGQVHSLVWVAEAETVSLGYTGDGEAGPRAFLLLHTGAAKIMAGVLDGL